MDTNLKAFMKEELKSRGTMTFDGIEKFKDKDGKPIPFIVNCLSMREIKEIRNNHRTSKPFRDRKNGGRVAVENGKVVMQDNYDAEKAGLEIMVRAFVQPKLNDPELMDYYGVLDELDMPEIIFADRDDFRYANECVMEACGLMTKEDEAETVEEIKN